MCNKTGKAILFIVFVLSIPATVFAVMGLKWTACADIPEPRGGPFAAVVGQTIYVVGGRSDSFAPDAKTVYAYDTTNNQWTTKTSVTTDLQNPAVGSLNDKIYLVIGSTDNGWISYDPTTGVTSTLNNKPYSAWGFASAIGVAPYVYAMGGGADGLARYDPGTNTWASLQSMLSARSFMSTVVLDGKIYTIGGRSDSSRVDAYDPVANSWTRKHNMIVSRGDYPAAGVLNGKIYVVGGAGSGTTIAESYDPSTDTWSTVACSPVNGSGWRFSPCSAVVGNTLYVISGSIENGTTSVQKAWLEDIPVQSSSSQSNTPNIPNIPSSVYPATGKMKILNNIIRGQGGVAYCLVSGAPFTGFTVKIISQGGLLYGTYDGTTGADGKAVVPINGRTHSASQGSDLQSGMYWVYANSKSGNSIRCRKPLVVVNE